MQVESAVRPMLDAYFPSLSGVQVLAQPGIFYVASAITVAVSVIGKKMVAHHWDSLAQGELWVFPVVGEIFVGLTPKSSW